MEAGIMVPLGAFAMVAAIVLVPRYFKRLEREKLYETLQKAYDKGQPVPPELIESLSRPEKHPKRVLPTPERDLRLGVILIAVALAMVALAMVTPSPTADWDDGSINHPLIGIAAFPGLIGFAFVAFGLIGRNRSTSQS